MSLVGLLRGVGMQLVSTAEYVPLDVLGHETVEMVRRGLACTASTA